MRKIQELLIELLGGLTKERAIELYASEESEVRHLRRINKELLEKYDDLVRLISSQGNQMNITSPPSAVDNLRPIGGRMSWPQRKYDLEVNDALRARDKMTEQENAS